MTKIATKASAARHHLRGSSPQECPYANHREQRERLRLGQDGERGETPAHFVLAVAHHRDTEEEHQRERRIGLPPHHRIEEKGRIERDQ